VYRDGKRWRGHIESNGVRRYARGSTKREVQARLNELARDGLAPKPRDRTTVAQWSATWLSAQDRRTAAGSLRPRTFQTYADDLRLYILPHLARARLDALTPAQVENMVARLVACGLSANTAAQALRTLHTMLAAAMKACLIQDNPASGLPHPRPVTMPEALTASQAEALMASPSPVGAARVAASCWLGMRQGEILGLRLDAVIWHGPVPGALRVGSAIPKKSWRHGPGCKGVGEHLPRDCPAAVRAGEASKPKTAAGTRVVPIPAALAGAFADQAAAAQALCELIGAPAVWLFPGPDGGPPNRDVDARRWRELVRRVLGQDAPTGTHAGRRCAATRLAEAGVPLYVASRIMGWSSGSLMDVYARVGDHVAAAEMDRVYGPPPT